MGYIIKEPGFLPGFFIGHIADAFDYASERR